LSAVGIASVLGMAQPAFAKSAPPVDTPPLDCFGDFGDSTIPNMLQPGQVINYAGSAGCVAVQVDATSQHLAWVVLADGWTYEVKSDGGGTNSKVLLLFSNASTGQDLVFRFEFGKVVVG
jgi:hypothetical protein